jgi:hypothetical protein
MRSATPWRGPAPPMCNHTSTDLYFCDINFSLQHLALGRMKWMGGWVDRMAHAPKADFGHLSFPADLLELNPSWLPHQCNHHEQHGRQLQRRVRPLLVQRALHQRRPASHGAAPFITQTDSAPRFLS